MYKLLIVDDERYIVESLAELFAAQKDLDLEILTAYYADEALDIFNMQKIDFVFLDIQMPGMNGIEAAKKINENWPDCRIIFLTGYSRFDYLYESKKLKNTSFLLKTESNTAILNALKSAIANYQKQQTYKLLVSQAEWTNQLLVHLSHADILRDFLHGKSLFDLHETIHQNKLFKFHTDFPVYLLYLKLQWTIPSDNYSQYQHTLVQLTLHFYHILNEKYHISMVDIDSDTVCVLIQPIFTPLSNSPECHGNYIRECLNSCIFSLTDACSCHFFIIMQETSVNWNFIEKTFESYRQYYTYILQHSLVQYDCIMLYKEDALTSTMDQDQPLPNMHSCIATLTSGLQQHDYKRITSALDLLEDNLTSIHSMHNLTAIHMYHKISNLYIDYITQFHLTEKIALKIGLYKLYNINQFENWKDVIHYYRQLSKILLNTLTEEENTSREKIVIQIKKYIQRNLNRQLSLNEISNHVNYNSSYVSRLFRQVTGENISQYTMQKKIEKAKEYLMEGNESIQHIAEKLGFETSQYFSSVFKKMTGHSPRDYRNLSL